MWPDLATFSHSTVAQKAPTSGHTALPVPGLTQRGGKSIIHQNEERERERESIQWIESLLAALHGEEGFPAGKLHASMIVEYTMLNH